MADWRRVRVDSATEGTWALPPDANAAGLARRLLEGNCPLLSAEQLDIARLLLPSWSPTPCAMVRDR